MQKQYKSKLTLAATLVIGCFTLAACGGGGGGGSSAPASAPVAVDTIQKLDEAKPTSGFLGKTGSDAEESVAVDSGEDLKDPLTPTTYVQYFSGEKKMEATGKSAIKEAGTKRAGLRAVLVKDGNVTGVVSGNVKGIFVTKMDSFRNMAVDEVGTHAKINETEIGGVKGDGNTKVITNVPLANEEGYTVKAGDDGRTSYWIIDPVTAGWNYQTYAGFESTTEAFKSESGFQSFGTLTENVPNDGTATYTGKSSAKVSTHDDSGVVPGARLTSDVTVKADFAKRSLDFTTSNTKGVDEKGTAYTATGFDKYNLKGTATWEDKSNKFIGTVETTGAEKFSGDINGRFYGGKAAEVGGTYGLMDETKATAITGGFGAKRP